MPITLKVVSWNLRTFGAPTVPDSVLDYIADIIVDELNPDVVCLQEIQIGSQAGLYIDNPISPSIITQLDSLLAKLQTRQGLANWQYCISGTNSSDRAKSMTDAYAFYWKVTPSQQSHVDAPHAITLLQGPTILRQEGGDHFPGRRPGLITLDVTREPSEAPVPFNLISWHAAVPCNTWGKTTTLKKGVSSGRAINALATLTDIGGGIQYKSPGSRDDYQFVNAYPLPNIDTLIVGDFNFSMAARDSDFVYKNLTTNYTPCVSTFDNVVLTTYSPDPDKPFVGSSSYDNIFILKPHAGLQPGLSFSGNSGAYNFIAEAARLYDPVQPWTFSQMSNAWYVCYQNRYKRQYAVKGISDHLPVWADITVEQSSLGNSHIKATSGDDHNSMFHALLGASVLGINGPIYFDADAATHRQQFVDYLKQTLQLANLGPNRVAILSAMVDAFETWPDEKENVEFLLRNPDFDPTTASKWHEMVETYLQGILGGRMLFVAELAVAAVWQNCSIKLWYTENGFYASGMLNPGQLDEREIYHAGLHFFHYQP